MILDAVREEVCDLLCHIEHISATRKKKREQLRPRSQLRRPLCYNVSNASFFKATGPSFTLSLSLASGQNRDGKGKRKKRKKERKERKKERKKDRKIKQSLLVGLQLLEVGRVPFRAEEKVVEDLRGRIHLPHDHDHLFVDPVLVPRNTHKRQKRPHNCANQYAA